MGEAMNMYKVFKAYKGVHRVYTLTKASIESYEYLALKDIEIDKGITLEKVLTDLTFLVKDLDTKLKKANDEIKSLKEMIENLVKLKGDE